MTGIPHEKRAADRRIRDRTFIESALLADVARLQGEVAELIDALSSVSEHNQHYGAGPHCTCSQRAREQIASDAIAKYAPRFLRGPWA